TSPRPSWQSSRACHRANSTTPSLRRSSATCPPPGPCARYSTVAAPRSESHLPRSPDSAPTRALRKSSCAPIASNPTITFARRTSMKKTEPRPNELRVRFNKLGLYGMAARLDELVTKPWLDELLAIEEAERQRRSLARRLRHARIGAFKPIIDFDWNWPRKI